MGKNIPEKKIIKKEQNIHKKNKKRKTKMPMPKPEQDEIKKDFIDRCVEELADEFKSKNQRLAICRVQWERKNEEE